VWENQTHVQLKQVEGQVPAAAVNVSETIAEDPEAEAKAAEATVRITLSLLC
jgi:hypothetical protein